MINVLIERNKDGDVNSFTITGHANAGEYGKDIVCAAISVLSQTTVLGLYEIAKIKVDYEVQDGNLVCRLPKELTNSERQKSNLLLETMIIGLKNIYENYSEYIVIHVNEV